MSPRNAAILKKSDWHCLFKLQIHQAAEKSNNRKQPSNILVDLLN